MTTIGNFGNLISNHSDVPQNEHGEDLHVQGTVEIDDLTLILNADKLSGTPTENASIVVKRGSSNDAVVKWDENSDSWKCGLVGSEKAILTTSNTLSTNQVAYAGSLNTISGNNNLTYDGTNLDIGNLSLSSNNISSSNTNGDINLTPNGTGNISLLKDVYVWANLNTNDIIPGVTNTYDLGTVSQQFKDLYLSGVIKNSALTDDRVVFQNGGSLIDDSSLTFNSSATKLQCDNLAIDDNTISSENVNGDINLSPDGTGKVNVNSQLHIVHNGSGSCLRVDDAISDTTYFSISQDGHLRLNRSDYSGGAIVDMRTTSADNVTENAYLFRNQSNNTFFSLVKQANASGTYNSAYMRLYDGSNAVGTSISGNPTHTSFINSDDFVVGNTTCDSSAKFEVNSSDRGFLPPRLTDTERDAISSPATGLMIYNTTTNLLNIYNGSSWRAINDSHV